MVPVLLGVLILRSSVEEEKMICCNLSGLSVLSARDGGALSVLTYPEYARLQSRIF